MASKKKTYAAMLQIGASAESIKELRMAINDILRAKVDQTTMRVALNTLAKGASVNNTSVSNCVFKGDGGNE